MRLARWHRVVATLLAFWLPLVVGEPAMAQPCPMHAPAAMQREMAPHHQGRTPHGTDRHQCVCVGCCASAVAIDAPSMSIVTIVVSQSPNAGGLVVAAATLSDAGQRLGLYTTGPPASAPVR